MTESCPNSDFEVQQEAQPEPKEPEREPLRRSKRTIKPPDRLNLTQICNRPEWMVKADYLTFMKLNARGESAERLCTAIIDIVSNG